MIHKNLKHFTKSQKSTKDSKNNQLPKNPGKIFEKPKKTQQALEYLKMIKINLSTTQLNPTRLIKFQKLHKLIKHNP